MTKLKINDLENEIEIRNDEQKKVAESLRDSLNKAKAFRRPIVTEISPISAFFKPRITTRTTSPATAARAIARR